MKINVDKLRLVYDQVITVDNENIALVLTKTTHNNMYTEKLYDVYIDGPISKLKVRVYWNEIKYYYKRKLIFYADSIPNDDYSKTLYLKYDYRDVILRILGKKLDSWDELAEFTSRIQGI